MLEVFTAIIGIAVIVGAFYFIVRVFATVMDAFEAQKSIADSLKEMVTLMKEAIQEDRVAGESSDAMLRELFGQPEGGDDAERQKGPCSVHPIGGARDSERSQGDSTQPT